VDCSVQTEAMPADAVFAYDNPAALVDEHKGKELVLDINSKARVVSWEIKPKSWAEIIGRQGVECNVKVPYTLKSFLRKEHLKSVMGTELYW